MRSGAVRYVRRAGKTICRGVYTHKPAPRCPECRELSTPRAIFARWILRSQDALSESAARYGGHGGIVKHIRTVGMPHGEDVPRVRVCAGAPLGIPVRWTSIIRPWRRVRRAWRGRCIRGLHRRRRSPHRNPHELRRSGCLTRIRIKIVAAGRSIWSAAESVSENVSMLLGLIFLLTNRWCWAVVG